MLFWLALLYAYQQTINAAPTPMGPVGHPILSHISSPSPGNILNSNCPNTRSTWAIVWNCLATIFACAWVSVHPNIPPPGTKEWQVAIIRSELMIWTIIAPEMMLFWAIRQWVGARRLAELYKDDHPIWSKTHGYFLQMGGFMLFDSDSNSEEYAHKIGVLSPERLAALSADRLIKFPTITEEEIEDRSKGDALSKTLVLGQTSWFIAQCITRKAEGLVMTELELVTLAFAALNSFMYFFWWNKPLDVRTTVPVYRLSTPLPEKEPELEETSSESASPQTKDPEEQHQQSWKFHKNLARMLVCLIPNLFIKWPYYTIVAIFSRLGDMAEFAGRSSDIEEGADHVHAFYAMNTTDWASNHILGVVAIIGTIFGAIHSAGWNFLFPTPIEATIWKICSLIVTCVPFLMLIPVICQDVNFPEDTFCLELFLEDVKNTLTRFEIFVGLPLYIIARIVLLTEALIALRNLPSGALLEVQWTSFLPHI